MDNLFEGAMVLGGLVANAGCTMLLESKSPAI